VPDEISPDICARLTGTDTTRSSGMLEKITNDTSLAGLVRRLSGEHGEAGARYACHHLFLEFLRGEAQDMTERYAAASDYYLEIGDGYAAVACALKSGRNENIAPAMMSLLRYDEFNNSIFQHLQSMSALISILPEAKYDELPYLYLLLAWHSNLAGDARRMFRALDRLYEVIPVIEAKYPEFLQSCLIIQFLDHRIPLEKMLDRALPPNVAEKFRAGKRSWPARSKNLPFFHKGGLDLSDYTGLPVDGAHLQGNTRMWGDETMRGVLRAGLWYEKNDLAPALSSALAGEESLRDPHAVPPETVFFTKMITVAILDAMERPDEANEHREELRRHIRERGALCLIPNLTAYEAKMRMTDGDDRAASDWLEKYFVDAGGMRSLELYKIFQHLTTARALMLRRAPREAKAFLLRTIKLAEDFRRVIDAAEARSLLAILEWHAGSRETAAAVLETATESVRRYNYVRVFADEGASILPILKSCIGRLRVNRSPGENGEEETAKKEEAMRYLNEIYTAAYARSRERAGIASAFRFSMPKITVQQKTTLLYLAKGYERKGIASKMGLSLETVKTHIKQLYEKLDAHSAEEAVYAAKKLGILEA
jgi:LuxR family maltose regulon positive regulatory protein